MLALSSLLRDACDRPECTARCLTSISVLKRSSRSLHIEYLLLSRTVVVPVNTEIWDRVLCVGRSDVVM